MKKLLAIMFGENFWFIGMANKFGVITGLSYRSIENGQSIEIIADMEGKDNKKEKYRLTHRGTYTIYEDITKDDKPTVSKTEQIRVLLKLTQQVEYGMQHWAEFLQQMLGDDSDTCQKITESITCEKITENLVVIYDQMFTDTEIDGLVQFYQTDLGKKVVTMTPEITRQLAKELQIMIIKMVGEL